MSDLTKRQQEVLDYIALTIRERQCPPSVREIGKHFGIRSPNAVLWHLRALEKKRKIQVSGKHRGITIRGRRVPKLPYAGTIK